MAIQTIDAASPAVVDKPGSGKHGTVGFVMPGTMATRRQAIVEQLALLLETGTALLPALESLQAQSSDAGTAQILEEVAEGIRGGQSFAEALMPHPELFPPTHIAIIRAAEEGGYLHRALHHLLDMDAKRQELFSVLSAAFTYPAFLIAFSGAVVVFVLGFVFPKFADLFASIANDLPATTRVLMWMSDLIQGRLLLVGAAALVSALALFWWLMSPSGTAAMHGVASRIPLLRDIMLKVYLVQTLRTVGLSLSNGVNLTDALAACAHVAPDRDFRAFINGVLKSVNEGNGVGTAFSNAEFLPPLVRQMMSTGDAAGELALVSTRVADHYQEELRRRLVSLSKMIEPALLLVMGLVVGLIVSSLILPIFKLARAVH